MATKAQLIQFIVEMFSEQDGSEITKQKLDKFKKAELEEFVVAKGVESELATWLDR